MFDEIKSGELVDLGHGNADIATVWILTECCSSAVNREDVNWCLSTVIYLHALSPGREENQIRVQPACSGTVDGVSSKSLDQVIEVHEEVLQPLLRSIHGNRWGL